MRKEKSNIEKIKELRQTTGLGLAEAKKLLDECGGDLMKAIVKGQLSPTHRGGR